MNHNDSHTELWHRQFAQHHQPIVQIVRERYRRPAVIDWLSFALGLGCGILATMAIVLFSAL
jgi:hypothetical protein